MQRNDDAHQTCKEKTYNPFYSTQHYFETATMEYWTKQSGAKLGVEDFDEELWWQFQCFNYNEHHEEQAAAGEECTKANYKDLLAPQKLPLEKETETLKSMRDENGLYLPKLQRENGVTQKVIHLTYVFQIFVFMQVFNQINARKLKEAEYNVFAGIFANWLFLAVTFVTFGVQMAMVEVGGRITKTYPLNMD